MATSSIFTTPRFETRESVESLLNAIEESASASALLPAAPSLEEISSLDAPAELAEFLGLPA